MTVVKSSGFDFISIGCIGFCRP